MVLGRLNSIPDVITTVFDWLATTSTCNAPRIFFSYVHRRSRTSPLTNGRAVKRFPPTQSNIETSHTQLSHTAADMERPLKRQRTSNIDIHRPQAVAPRPNPSPALHPSTTRPSTPDTTVPPYGLWQAIHILDDQLDYTVRLSFSQHLLLNLARNGPAIATQIRRALRKHKSVASIGHCLFIMSNLDHITGIHACCCDIQFYVADKIAQIAAEAGEHSSFATKRSALFTLMKIAEAMLAIKDKTLRTFLPAYLVINKCCFTDAVRKIFMDMSCEERWEMIGSKKGALSFAGRMDQLSEDLDHAKFFVGLRDVVDDVVGLFEDSDEEEDSGEEENQEDSDEEEEETFWWDELRGPGSCSD